MNSIVDPRDPDYCERCGGECVESRSRQANGGGGEELSMRTHARVGGKLVPAAGNHGGKPRRLLSMHEVAQQAKMSWASVRALVQQGVVVPDLVETPEGKRARTYFKREAVAELKALKAQRKHHPRSMKVTHVPLVEGMPVPAPVDMLPERRDAELAVALAAMCGSLGRIERLLGQLVEAWR